MTVAGIAKYELFNPLVDCSVIHGSFLPNGSGAVAATYGAIGWSVARTGVGVFRVTITRRFYGVPAGPIAWKTSDETNFVYLRVSNVTMPTASANGYFDITHLASTDPSTTNYVAADITASGVLRRINFMMTVANTSAIGDGI